MVIKCDKQNIATCYIDLVKNEIIPENKVKSTHFVSTKLTPSNPSARFLCDRCATCFGLFAWVVRREAAQELLTNAFPIGGQVGVSPNSSWSNKLMVGVTS